MTDFAPYLASTTYIDWEDPRVSTEAVALADGCGTEVDTLRNCFYFVRDRIAHSWDHRRNPVTCKASEVLEHGTGYCYAKAHLLAALLRANAIPAGLCYQRLSTPSEPPQFYLHGMVAAYLRRYGWYRMDPRGEKPGVHADCTPPLEALPYTADRPGECTLPEIWPEPLPVIVNTLTTNPTVEDVFNHLPDVELVTQTPR